MKTAPGTYGIINGQETFIPEVRLGCLVPGEKAAAVKGYAYTVAVLNAEGLCVGWMLAQALITPERPTLDTDNEVTRVS